MMSRERVIVLVFEADEHKCNYPLIPFSESKLCLTVSSFIYIVSIFRLMNYAFENSTIPLAIDLTYTWFKLTAWINDEVPIIQ